MKEAIQKAIEGGWGKEQFSASHLNLRVVNTEEGSIDMPLDCVFLDPLFWQALGKAMGWEGKVQEVIDTRTENPRFQVGGWVNKGDWKTEWHRFIDHLAEGKDAESFFNELFK